MGITRVLSKMGYCSRSDAAILIRAGRVTLNGRAVRDPESPVQIPQDRIEVDGSPVQKATPIYLVMNKPRGVVTTASDAHKSGRLDLEDLQSEKSYAAMRVYGTSKLCNILFTRELAKRSPELHANCFHPGVVRTGFGKNENGIWKVLTTLAGPFFRSPARGARSLIWLSLSDETASLSGEYIEDEKVAKPSAQAQDEVLAEGLWERSAALVGLPADAPA